MAEGVPENPPREPASGDATPVGRGASSTRDAPPPPPLPGRLLTAFLWLATVVLVFYLLVIGQALIIPLVLAFFAWYLINTLNKLTRSIRVGDWRPPRWLAFALSAFIVVAVLIGLALLIHDNVNKVQQKAPEYRQRILEISAQLKGYLPEDMSESVKQMFRGSDDEPVPADSGQPANPGQATATAAGAHDPGRGSQDTAPADSPADANDDADADRVAAADGVEIAAGREPDPGERDGRSERAAAYTPPPGDAAGSIAPSGSAPSLAERFRNVDLTGLLQAMAATLGSFAGSAALVLAYLFFIFLEQRFFDAKLRMLIKDDQRRQEVQGIIAEIDRDIRSYIGVKTLVSALTAGLSYIIMKIAGLDFAEFWAVLLFVFNYIPNIGSLVATALPAGLALIQLDVTWFLVVAIGITAVQLAMANLVEPNLMGKSLNQSPLVVILSLVLWGTLWGVAGMFLCVPITVVVMIVLSHFPQTRWVPVMLSLDGRVRGDPEVRRIEASHAERPAGAQSASPAP